MTRFFAAESVRISPGIRELQPLITSLALSQSSVRQKSSLLRLLVGHVCVGAHLQSEWENLPRQLVEVHSDSSAFRKRTCATIGQIVRFSVRQSRSHSTIGLIPTCLQ